ncbi:MAG: SMP-30/gluconolactonase/LRE family protein, partial [Pseudomonadota bacterium]
MTYRFATAEKTVLSKERASVFFDGIFSNPRLQHPEGVAIGPDGWIWCGSENGEILRIDPDGKKIECVASTGGFTLGLAFLGDEALFICDLKSAAIFRLDLVSRQLKRFTKDGIKIPNYPVIDIQRGRLLVSDSFHPETPGPGIWAYDLQTGEGGLWYDEPMMFANGLALAPDGQSLFACETFARQITIIPILSEGRAGASRPFVTDLPGLPDGIAFDDHGDLYCGCYEPSRVVRISGDGTKVDIYLD